MDAFQNSFENLSLNAGATTSQTGLDFKYCKISQKEAHELEKNTRAQSYSDIWRKARKGRITSSFFGRVNTCKTGQEGLLSSIMGYSSPPENLPALKWGRENESNARDAFIESESQYHNELVVWESGLVVDPKRPHLGASPDGIVSCKCCPAATLELKCPWSSRNMTIAECVKQSSFCLDENFKLKSNHTYYAQVQGQMALCKLDRAYFVVYTRNDVHVEMINFNQEFWAGLEQKLNRYYVDYVFPDLECANPRNKIKDANLNCSCTGGRVEKIVLCEQCGCNYVHAACAKESSLEGAYCTACNDSMHLSLNAGATASQTGLDFKFCKISQKEAYELEKNTRAQSFSDKWRKAKIGRITSSLFGRVNTCKTGQEGLLSSVMGYPDPPENSPALKWGQENESNARDAFIESESQYHNKLVVQQSGLVVDPKRPHLGASPDGIVKCKCCRAATLELKCPWSSRNMTIAECVKKSGFCLDKNFKLKSNHAYYAQVQGQMALCKLDRAYFVVFTREDLHVEVIKFDPEFWAGLEQKLNRFYVDYVFPELQSGNLLSKIEEANSNCSCEGGERRDGKVVLCEHCGSRYVHAACAKDNYLFERAYCVACNDYMCYVTYVKDL